MKKITALILITVLSCSVTAFAATPGTEFLDRLEMEQRDGILSAEEALLYKFHYGFGPEKLPKDYQPTAFSPLKSGTAILAEYERMRPELSAPTIAAIEDYLQPAAKSAAATVVYLSPGGNFRVTYETTGANAVPMADTTPPNGIPDFVENCAIYMDTSWDVEITTLGFTAPTKPSGYYEVNFEDMNYYGYTSTGGGTTSITLHNDFLGFPDNEDPEGNQWGAAKATACHEFKHASQYAQSSWSESGWVELDATWAEDIVYDYVNDYYNYLPSGSPISEPATPLNSGGTGSYEDCIWQLYMSETFGDQIVPDFWTWRSTNQGQGVMNSYEVVLGDYGITLRDAWADFTAWNYTTGTRAITGIGYGEASSYPTAALTSVKSSYPAVQAGTISQLAANMIRCSSLPTSAGVINVVFDGEDGTEVVVTAIIEKTDGTGVLERIVLDANNNADVDLSVAPGDIADLGFAVGNGELVTSTCDYSLTVDFVPPTPGIATSAPSVAANVEMNTTTTEYLDVSNNGAAYSVLDIDITVLATEPAKAAPNAGVKSVAGSTVTCPLSEYLPGHTYSIAFTVANASTDEEWLTDVTVDFPAGTTVTSSSSFVGGTHGPMTSDGATGDGALVSWHGDTGTPNFYGVVVNGESAVATIGFTVGAGVTGDQTISWNIVGDDYGSNPHSIAGSIVLSEAPASVLVLGPNGGEFWSVGEAVNITWEAERMDDVMIELSRNGGADWETLIASTPDDGTYDWTVTGPASTNCLMRVGSLDAVTTDVSDLAFTIYAPVTWLTVSPLLAAIPEGDSQQLDLDFDAAGLAADTYSAWLIITSSAPASPTVVPVTMTVTDISAAGDMPAVFRLEGNYPNPFNPKTSINFSLAKAGSATVDVLDLRGHLVRRLFQGELSAGEHTISWDGCDGSGRALASGTYLARLRSSESTSTTKMLLAR